MHHLDFVFKSGTALLLATETPKRFSIDIDIITEEPEDKIKAVLQKTSQLEMFIRWEDDNDRKHTPDTPIKIDDAPCVLFSTLILILCYPTRF